MSADGLNLIVEVARLQLIVREQATELEAFRAELATALIRTQDLVEALQETLAWIEMKSAGDGELPRQYNRWAALI